jgi:hypothetical protein
MQDDILRTIGRIAEGKFYYKDLIFVLPTIHSLYKVERFAQKIYSENKYNNWLNIGQCLDLLKYNGIWNDDLAHEFAGIDKKINNSKIDICKSFFNFREREIFRAELQELNDRKAYLYGRLHSLDYLTLGGFVDIVAKQYELTQVVHNRKGRLINNFYNFPFKKIQRLHVIYTKNELSHQKIREVAKHSDWSSYWRTSKEDVFGKNGVYLSVEQRNLILYSQMYDNVLEHPESPVEAIIQDDDALDGWFLIQKDKQKAQKNETLTGPNVQGNEIFLPAYSQADIERIDDMNTLEGKMIKNNRNNMIQRLGLIKESQLPDKQMDIMNQVAENLRR